MNEEKNHPVMEYRINGVKAVVWKNETRNGSMFNTTLVRVYKDKDDQWQETTSLGRDDLLAAAKVLDQAHSFITIHEQAKSEPDSADTEDSTEREHEPAA